jgi:hypothetical protein
VDLFTSPPIPPDPSGSEIALQAQQSSQHIIEDIMAIENISSPAIRKVCWRNPDVKLSGSLTFLPNSQVLTPEVLTAFKEIFKDCDHRKLDELLNTTMPKSFRDRGCRDKGDILKIVGKVLQRREHPGSSWRMVNALQHVAAHPNGLGKSDHES